MSHHQRHLYTCPSQTVALEGKKDPTASTLPSVDMTVPPLTTGYMVSFNLDSFNTSSYLQDYFQPGPLPIRYH